MALKEEIAAKRKEIIVDSYPMSIGEIMNLYKDQELDVHPEFQRFFRWDDEQKTKLIESILLGIPIPPVFVAQRINGKWDVIDGQQRLSTILQFTKLLKKDDGTDYDPLVLQATKFLPSLDGVKWEDNHLFPNDQKITFKREKISFTIIKETTDSDEAKYEMFQRLNTGGTHLSPQELRNCLLIMINRDFYLQINEMNENINFRNCITLTDSRSEERYDLEMIVRYLLYTKFDHQFLESLNKSRNMDIFLTEELEKIAKDPSYPLQENINKFYRIFNLLNETLGENTFKRYKCNKFTGGTLLSSFEAIIPGIFLNINYWEHNKTLLKEKIENLYSHHSYELAMRRGTRALDRMSQLILFSREWFINAN